MCHCQTLQTAQQSQETNEQTRHLFSCLEYYNGFAYSNIWAQGVSNKLENLILEATLEIFNNKVNVNFLKISAVNFRKLSLKSLCYGQDPSIKSNFCNTNTYK